MLDALRSTDTSITALPACFRLGSSFISVEVSVRPGAPRSELVRVEEHRLVIAVAAAPDRGKANEELLRMIAKLVNVSRSEVSILKGHAARRKTIRIETENPSACAARLIEAWGGTKAN
jgi:uncharacterized protein (TIGR00251 family)